MGPNKIAVVVFCLCILALWALVAFSALPLYFSIPLYALIGFITPSCITTIRSFHIQEVAIEKDLSERADMRFYRACTPCKKDPHQITPQYETDIINSPKLIVLSSYFKIFSFLSQLLPGECKNKHWMVLISNLDHGVQKSCLRCLYTESPFVKAGAQKYIWKSLDVEEQEKARYLFVALHWILENPRAIKKVSQDVFEDIIQWKTQVPANSGVHFSTSWRGPYDLAPGVSAKAYSDENDMLHMDLTINLMIDKEVQFKREDHVLFSAPEKLGSDRFYLEKAIILHAQRKIQSIQAQYGFIYKSYEQQIGSQLHLFNPLTGVGFP